MPETHESLLRAEKPKIFNTIAMPEKIVVPKTITTPESIKTDIFATNKKPKEVCTALEITCSPAEDELEKVAEGARQVEEALRIETECMEQFRLQADSEDVRFTMQARSPAISSSDEEFEMLEAACGNAEGSEDIANLNANAFLKKTTESNLDPGKVIETASENTAECCIGETSTEKADEVGCADNPVGSMLVEATYLGSNITKPDSISLDTQSRLCTQGITPVKGNTTPNFEDSEQRINSPNSSTDAGDLSNLAKPRKSGLPKRIGGTTKSGLPVLTSPVGSSLPVLVPKSVSPTEPDSADKPKSRLPQPKVKAVKVHVSVIVWAIAYSVYIDKPSFHFLCV